MYLAPCFALFGAARDLRSGGSAGLRFRFRPRVAGLGLVSVTPATLSQTDIQRTSTSRTSVTFRPCIGSILGHGRSGTSFTSRHRECAFVPCTCALNLNEATLVLGASHLHATYMAASDPLWAWEVPTQMALLGQGVPPSP